MSDVISDVVRYRAALMQTRAALNEIHELVLEEGDCDCPPEWPRCLECRVRQVAMRAYRAVDEELKRVRL